jgi:hypothetical protein
LGCHMRFPLSVLIGCARHNLRDFNHSALRLLGPDSFA